MHLYRLGRVSWQDSQLAYHALAHLGRQGLILCSPAEPYVSVGYFQDPAQELDLDHCRQRGLPVFRREVGGGAVYLDQHQLFWQVVLKRDHPLVSLNREAFYRRFLAPVVAVYRDLGAEASVAPVNDVAVGERRITGTGAGEIGDCVVFVGNLMRRFDCAAMAQVLRVPDPDFRRSFLGHMQSQLTSLRRELGSRQEASLNDDQLYDLLAGEFASVMGTLEPHDLDDELRGAMERLGRRMLSPAWTYQPRRGRPHRKVKVRAGLYLHHWLQDSPRGPIEARFTSLDGKVLEVSLRGSESGSPREASEYIGVSVADLTQALSAMAPSRG
ncbi:MAG: lipoate--protein ligase family protein [Desulfarculaceae bacterium]|nr:lipoate--protein ligase family protein [Desulfarculaceae bacterium]MCF8099712.1 lipoate--protein ligase family protein [Desulfarculaceae bacterium]MCF8124322.1 lipoate--protein ligase family protein [Desulfarculaceae bacterium]